MKSLVIVAIVAILVAVGVSAFAADIVTVPTANQLKAGQFDVAYYYLGLDEPPGAPQHVQAQTLYVGLTNEIELDVHGYEVDKDRNSAIINASYLAMKETQKLPDVVLGTRNLFEEKTSNNPVVDSRKRSYFLCLAKTLNLPPSGPPKLPIVRLHLSYGTDDNTLLGQTRHNGIFGGVQMKLTPQIGAIVLHDHQDVITGLTYNPPVMPQLTVKGGTYGKHWWVGMSYASK